MIGPKQILPLLALAGLTALVGCGDGRPPRVPVSGRVTIDGQPVTKGFVQIIPKDARAAQAPLDAEGRFRLETFDPEDGCVVGKHQVAVISNEPLSTTKIRWLVPQKYRRPETSGLWVEIAGPTDNLEIPLTWDGGKPFIEETVTQGDIDLAPAESSP